VSDTFEARTREELVKTGLWADDIRDVLTLMDAAERVRTSAPASFGGGVLEARRDDGEILAYVWWDAESETWLCNWERGSGA
jgi:hypothetical protein